MKAVQRARAPRGDEPLWKIPIPVIVLTGEVFTGKTTFVLSINPDPETTAMYDLELSATSLVKQNSESNPFRKVTYINVQEEIGKAFKGKARTQDLWPWFKADIRKRAELRKFRVIAADPISEIEDSLAAYIIANPGKFNLTANQIAKTPALMWGAMKAEWKRLLASIAGLVECVALTVHMRSKFVGNAPTSEKEPMGKETIRQLATVFLQLKKSKTSGIPNATVLKSRLEIPRKSEYGIEYVPVLPDFIKSCDPSRIRWYIENPFGVKREDLDDGSNDEDKEKAKLELQAIIETSRKESAELRLQAAKEESRTEKRRDKIREENESSKPNVKEDPESVKMITVLSEFKRVILKKGVTPGQWRKLMVRYGGDSELVEKYPKSPETAVPIDKLPSLLLYLAKKLKKEEDLLNRLPGLRF